MAPIPCSLAKWVYVVGVCGLFILAALASRQRGRVAQIEHGLVTPWIYLVHSVRDDLENIRLSSLPAAEVKTRLLVLERIIDKVEEKDRVATWSSASLRADIAAARSVIASLR